MFELIALISSFGSLSIWHRGKLNCMSCAINDETEPLLLSQHANN